MGKRGVLFDGLPLFRFMWGLLAAVDATNFTPDPSARQRDTITAVVLSRMMYRKGIDLLAACIPVILRQHPHVKFVIGALPHAQVAFNCVSKGHTNDQLC
jgi:phosphatidylinositol glycan class A protein